MSACLFPHLAASTGYRKGCRCPVCQRQHRADMRRWEQNKPPQCFQSGLSQSTIDEWARRTWEQMNTKEQQVVREILT